MRRSLNILTSLLLSLAVGSAWAADFEIGSPVPDFTLKQVGGSNVKRSEQVGNVMVLVFSAAGCGACKKTVKSLTQAMEGLQHEGIISYAISTDRYESTADDMRKDMKIGFPVLLDDKGVTRWQYGVRELPTLLIVDRDGRLKHAFSGPAARKPDHLAELIRAVAEE